MDEQLIKAVEDLGLSQKEARVYLANLSLGPATVQQIADQSGIKRVTTYVILEALGNLGLSSQTTQGRKTYFNAEDPVALRRLLEKKEQEVSEQRQHFNDLLPQLKTIRSLPKEAPGVRFYEGTEGIKSIISSFYEAHPESRETKGITNLDQLYNFFPEFENAGGNPQRVKARVKSKVLYTTVRGPILKSTDKAMNRESRFVPADKYPINGDWSIVGNHIVVLSFTGSKPIGVTVNSEELAKGMLAFFDLAWEAAKQYN